MKLKSVEKLENSKVSLEVQVEKEEFEAAIERSYRKNVGKINVPGFRKGKAPRKIIERMYGPSVFLEDAVNFAFRPHTRRRWRRPRSSRWMSPKWIWTIWIPMASRLKRRLPSSPK